MSRKLIVAVVALLVLVLGVTSVVMAQDTTPSTPTPNTAPQPPFGKFGKFGWFGGRDWGSFDAMAEALKLTPTELFEQLHSGKTLAEIAEAQGVDLQALQDAAQKSRAEAMKKAIEDAVQAGKITREQADWMLKGIENGWAFGPGRMGGCLGRGFGGMRGFRGFGPGLAPSNGGTRAPAVVPGSQRG